MSCSQASKPRHTASSSSVRGEENERGLSSGNERQSREQAAALSCSPGYSSASWLQHMQPPLEASLLLLFLRIYTYTWNAINFADTINRLYNRNLYINPLHYSGVVDSYLRTEEF